MSHAGASACQGRRFLSKVSAKRILKNREMHHASARWKSHGLGLQDAYGAIKSDLVDLNVPQSVIDEVLEKSLGPQQGGDMGTDDGIDIDDQPEFPVGGSSTCITMFGVCERTPLFDVAKHCARQFGSFTTEKQLSAGSLVRIVPSNGDRTCEIESEAAYFFLGVHCKKPLLQVFVQAKPVPNKKDTFCVVAAGNNGQLNNMPCFFPSFQVFLELLTSSQNMKTSMATSHTGSDSDGLPFKAFHIQAIAHTFHRHLWSVQNLEVVASHVVEDFVISLSASLPKKHAGERKAATGPVKLPFGLKLEPKKRHRKEVKAKRGQGVHKKLAGAPAPAKKPSTIPSPSALAPQSDSDDQPSGSSGAAQAADVDSDSDESSSSGESVSVDSDSDSSGPSQQAEAESKDDLIVVANANAGNDNDAVDMNEDLELPTPVAFAEEAKIAEAIQEFKSDNVPTPAAAAPPGPAPARGAGGATYFKQELGFDEASIAPTARSKCYQCNEQISRGSVRYSYFWDSRRPSRYVHAGCVVAFVRAKLEAGNGACKAQAVDAMGAITSNLAVANDAGKEKIKAATLEVLSQLSAVGSTAVSCE